MLQRTLFDPPNTTGNTRPLPTPRVADTTKAAADRMAPKAKSIRGAVLRFFVQRGAVGGTDDELFQFCDGPENSLRPRRGELTRMGYLEDSGKRRKTRAGCAARVWVYTGKTWNPDEVGI